MAGQYSRAPDAGGALSDQGLVDLLNDAVETAEGAAPQAHEHIAADVTDLGELATMNVGDLGGLATCNPAAAQADSTAAALADLVADFNALLAKLRAAGIIGS